MFEKQKNRLFQEFAHNMHILGPRLLDLPVLSSDPNLAASLYSVI